MGFNDGAVRFWDLERSASLGTVFITVSDKDQFMVDGPTNHGVGPYPVSAASSISTVAVIPST